MDPHWFGSLNPLISIEIKSLILIRIETNADPQHFLSPMCRKMEVSRVDPEGEKTPLSSLSGGEKVIIQMCLIFALWTVS
jgi:hypothetical protein